MTRSKYLLAALLITIACRASGSQTPPGTLVALTNVTLIDGTGAPPRPGVTLIIDGSRIREIRPAGSALPAGVQVRDLSGKFVIPGLIDAHVHLGTQDRPAGVMERVLRACFLGGITRVRDMGGRHEIVVPLARLGAGDTVPVPRVSYSTIVAGPGMWIDGDRSRFFAGSGTPGETSSAHRLLSAADVAPAIRAAKSGGATGIKIYNGIEPELVTAVAREARTNGLKVWSHTFTDAASPSDVLRAGAEVVSHADMFVSEVIPRDVRLGGVAGYRAARLAAYADPALMQRPAIQALLRTMKEQGTILDATLFVMRPEADSSGRLRIEPGSLFQNAAGFARAAHAAGVDLSAGTDAIGGSTPNLHTELQILVDHVGMTPLQAIRAATMVSARAAGLGDSVGTLAPGKVADLVVLHADPSVDIANTITVSAVMKAGRYHERPRPMPTPPGARPPQEER